jgi:hypothetical protein
MIYNALKTGTEAVEQPPPPLFDFGAKVRNKKVQTQIKALFIFLFRGIRTACSISTP